jgi:hypothetical protein
MLPTFNSHDSESNRPKITRRRVLAVTAGAAGTAVGATALASEEAAAEIQFGGLTVSDGTLEAEDPTPTPIVDVDARLAYTVDSVTSYNVAIELGPDHESRDMIDFINQDTSVTDGEFTENLTAPVTDHDAFSASDFAPAKGETVTEDVAVALTLSVMDGGTTKAADSIEYTATITVTNTAIQIELRAGGEGEIRFETTA